jgi:hypothetical protein
VHAAALPVVFLLGLGYNKSYKNLFPPSDKGDKGDLFILNPPQPPFSKEGRKKYGRTTQHK